MMSIDYRVYLKTRDQYLVNAEKLLAKREYRKAFELLWGAIAQSIKALVAKRGYRLGTHRQIINFMREVAKELRDEEIYKSFLLVHKLHINFYCKVIDPKTLIYS